MSATLTSQHTDRLLRALVTVATQQAEHAATALVNAASAAACLADVLDALRQYADHAAVLSKTIHEAAQQ